MLTDIAGSACTYAGVTTAVVAAPAPTTTTFSVTPGGGATLTIGRAVTIGATGQVGVISGIATDAITLSNTLATAPSTSDVVTMPSSTQLVGAKSLAYTATVKTADLRGDNSFLDTDTVLEALEFDLDVAKFNFTGVSTLHGGTVVSSGTTPNQSTLWKLLNNPAFGYFKLEARCVTADPLNGDVHILVSKAKAADMWLLGFADEDYAPNKLKIKAVPPQGTNPWFQIGLFETALAIP